MSDFTMFSYDNLVETKGFLCRGRNFLVEIYSGILFWNKFKSTNKNTVMGA